MILCEQAMKAAEGSGAAAMIRGSTSDEYRKGREDYGRCAVKASASVGAASCDSADPSPGAVADFITFDEHDDPHHLKRLHLPALPGSDEQARAAAGVEALGPTQESGHDQETCVRSGVSVAMLKSGANNIASEQTRLNHHSACDDEQWQQVQEPPERSAQSPVTADGDDSVLDILPTSPFSHPTTNGASSDVTSSSNHDMSDDQLNEMLLESGRVLLARALFSNGGTPQLIMFAANAKAVEPMTDSGLIALTAEGGSVTPSSDISVWKGRLSGFRKFLATT